MIIVYSSKSGSSKQYAEILSEHTGIPAFAVGSEPKGESVVFFGWLRKDTVIGLNHVERSDLRAVCVVGLDDERRFSKDAIRKRNAVNVPVYYLRGWIDRSKLNIIDKTVLNVVSAVMKIKGLNQYNQPIFDAMMEGGSFFDEKYLEPVELFLKGTM